jgi:hypothetical protein
LIQKKQTTENIDSRNCLLGVKNCTLIVGHRLFQQHRPKPEVERPILLCCTTECRAEHGARSRWRRENHACRRTQ